VGEGSDTVSVASFVAAQRTDHGIPHAVSCRVLGMSESWFYKWRDRAPTPRQQRRARLDADVRRSYVDSDGDYGSPRVRADLHEWGWKVSTKTVAASMARQGLVGRPTRRRFRCLTRPDKAARPVPDLVKRDFTAPAVNLKWCGDLTEVPTDEGKLYLAHVEDLASRRIPGFAMSEHHDAPLAVAALQMAAAVRGGDVHGVIFHSDHGSEYSAELFETACRRLGVTQSMGRVGSCFDNAASESFHSNSNCCESITSPPAPRPAPPWPRTSIATTEPAGTAPVRCTRRSSTRRSSPPESPKPSTPRRRRENRPPRSP
jgi:putative transposase